MTLAESSDTRPRRRSQRALIASRETNWGVIVSEVALDKRALAFTESTLRYFGLLVVLASGTIPFLNLPVVTTLGLALAFVFVGFSIFRHANNGFRRELRIDTRFGNVRVGTVNAAGDFYERQSFRKPDVESFFIQRSKTHVGRLCMRLKKSAQPVVLFKGPEDDLIPSFERIVEALYVEKGSGKRVKTRANDRFINATFA